MTALIPFPAPEPTPEDLVREAQGALETYRRSPWLSLPDSERLRALRAALGTLQRLQEMENGCPLAQVEGK